MPVKAPSICKCGKVIPTGVTCVCVARDNRERKARFDKTRPSARARGYTAEWTKESKAFLADNPRCRRCTEAAAVVDHIVPHKGDMKLFWDRSNWQPLCRPHHNGAKQSEERRQQKDK